MPTDHHQPAAARVTSPPARLNARAESSPGPIPATDLIAFLQRTLLSCTQGYDVVSILAADRVNELFGQEYVTRAQAAEVFAPVSGTVPIAGNLQASFTDLRLGPPLISFSPGAEPQQANLRVEFLSGTVMTQQVDNGVTTVLSTQHVQPGTGLVLTGVVPLVDVQGETDPTSHEVRIDITNGSDFAAHLGIPGASAHTVLGQYFLDLMKRDASSWAYVLGSLNFTADPAMKLVPTSFEIATQVDSSDPADTGRVLLFITTAYGNAPAGRPAAMQLSNMVPAGSTTTLIVANRVLVAGMVRDAIQSRLAQFGGTTSAKPAEQDIPGSLYTVTVEGGSINLGQIKFTPPWKAVTYYSGTADSSPTGLPVHPGNVVVPLSGIAVAVGKDGNGLNTTVQLPWSQQWAAEFHAARYSNAVSGTISVTLSATGLQAATVDAAGTVNFGTPPPLSVSYGSTSFWDNEQSADAVGDLIKAGAEARLQPVLSIQLPAVQTFAVNNLLFPSDHNITFSSAYVPGDLVTFGDLATSAITVKPLFATLAPGQTSAFSATSPSGSAVHWELGQDPVGSIANGKYKAPQEIDAPTFDVVTAWTTDSGSRQSASAFVTLVPAGLSVSPDYVFMTPGDAPQQFVAAAAGQSAPAIQWSLIGAGGGSGTLVNGLYTPPAQLTALQPLTVRATNTADGSTADALLILAPHAPEGVQVQPPVLATPLAAGMTQQFTATPAAGVTWSVVPAIGTITSGGLYTAPQNVQATTTVTVIATVYAPYVFGLATFQVGPSAPADGMA